MIILSVERIVAQLEDDDLICNFNRHNPPSYYVKSHGDIYSMHLDRLVSRLEQMSKPVLLKKSVIDPKLFDNQRWKPYKEIRGK